MVPHSEHVGLGTAQGNVVKSGLDVQQPLSTEVTEPPFDSDIALIDQLREHDVPVLATDVACG